MLSKLWDPRTARVLFTILIFAIVVLFLRATADTLTLFLLAILFAYFVDPLVTKIQGPLRGRIKAIAVVYLFLIVLLIGLGLLIGPKVADEGKSLAATLPSLLSRLSSGDLVRQVGQNHGLSPERQAQIQAFFEDHKDVLPGYARAVGEKLAEPASHIWWLILIPILSLFFLKDGESMADQLISLGRVSKERATLAGIVSDVNIMLGSYIRSQLILSALTLVAYTLVLSLMGVPYSFILGPLAGVFEFVPVVGPAAAAVAVFGIGVLTGYPHLFWLFVFLGAWRLIQDYVSAPKIMGESLEISPLVQIFAVLAGGEMAGVLGALISVPVVAILRILWRRISSHEDLDAPAVTVVPLDKHAPEG
jgi:predicted PurR-regulated permease PerM